ncbi:Panacea domain-containing protein [Roseospira goensis]|uniref:Putative phage-associated protein n=1 Tax=Roseospira goensis TaxID=391922 RepID=A0A7W6RYT5_9PROT|nr:type II toxin-antitoxin system antitoxin SocA domain-containing protein [Roseospira goensis]MBB4285753.1 putative phage-associated protein [Roseospira goensis]
MYSAITIADEILKIAKRAGRALTPLQLMKLVYIAHGYSLAVLNRDLFPDRIEAWKYGPVIPDLYRATKRFGRREIPFSCIDDGDTAVDSETRQFLEEVFSKYGHLSGYALSSLTHRSGTPWDRVYRDGAFGLEIPDDLIRDHYVMLAHEHAQDPGATA